MKSFPTIIQCIFLTSLFCCSNIVSAQTKVVTVKTAMGRTTVMSVSDRYKKASLQRIVAPDGTITTTEYRNDETTATKHADGTEITLTNGPDIRYGMMSPIPKLTEVKLPSGMTSLATMRQEALYADILDPSSIQQQTNIVTENWRTSTSVYDFLTRTITNTSPKGRQSVSTIDEQGRITSTQIPGIEPVYYSYDRRGRLQFIHTRRGRKPASKISHRTLNFKELYAI